MKNIKSICLIPILIPLLFVFIVSILNYSKPVKIKFIIWESSPISLGLWMSMAGIGGAVLSSISTLKLTSTALETRRTVITEYPDNHPDVNASAQNQTDNNNSFDNQVVNDGHKYFERELNEPTPTVSVPFRIISKSKNREYNPKTTYTDNFDKTTIYQNDYQGAENKNNPYDSKEAKEELHQPINQEDWFDDSYETW